MPARPDIAKLAADQGVLPCHDVQELQGNGWPAEDSIEEFERFLRSSLQIRFSVCEAA
jgi:hypothetical protein